MGGGTGGHITPLLAVAHSLKVKKPHAQLHYVIERGNKFAHLVQENKNIDSLHTIFAGKFRRYHGESFLQHLMDVLTILKNIRDFFFVVIGIIQSIYKVKKINPDIVFIKGGFVGVPIGLACRLWHIPYITHDSDVTAGLANRIISKGARLHATGMPAQFYNYPKDKTAYVGIPLNTEYNEVTSHLRSVYRESIGVPSDAQLLAITGGSLGALRLNDAVKLIAPKLLKKFKHLYIFHQTGGQQTGVYSDIDTSLKGRIIEKPFVPNLYEYTGAADVVIARAGATTIAELAVQHKPCILVPNPALTGGQQSKNAQHLESAGAALVVSEHGASVRTMLSEAVSRLLEDSELREKLEYNIAGLAKPNAASTIADIIITESGLEG